MVIDFKADPKFAKGHYVVDAETGEPICVYYADDEAGVYRRYLDLNEGKPGPRQYYSRHKVTGELPTRRFSDMPRDEAEQYEIAWEEVRRPIRILPMPPIEG
jgi:hypothetical protein